MEVIVVAINGVTESLDEGPQRTHFSTSCVTYVILSTCSLARQIYWEKRLSVDPKIPALCNPKNLLKTTKRLDKLKPLLVLTCSL